MKIRKEMESIGVIKNGHFLLTSGRHSDTYINKDAIFCNDHLFSMVLAELNNIIQEKIEKCDVITGPAVAGAILAVPLALMNNKTFVYPEKNYTAEKIYDKNEILVYPETEKDRSYKWGVVSREMIFRRGYDKVLKNKNVVLTEDIITTGGSVDRTIEAIGYCGGKVTAVICIWNRSNYKPKNIPIFSLINEEVKSWEKEDCPLCKQGILLVDPKE